MRVSTMSITAIRTQCRAAQLDILAASREPATIGDEYQV
jgi:hypothetical protein